MACLVSGERRETDDVNGEMQEKWHTLLPVSTAAACKLVAHHVTGRVGVLFIWVCLGQPDVRSGEVNSLFELGLTVIFWKLVYSQGPFGSSPKFALEEKFCLPLFVL